MFVKLPSNGFIKGVVRRSDYDYEVVTAIPSGGEYDSGYTRSQRRPVINSF